MKTRPTADAAGCSDRTLKRNMDVRGGCLNLGEHYRHGPSANSSYLWNVDLVIEAWPTVDWWPPRAGSCSSNSKRRSKKIDRRHNLQRRSGSVQ